MFFYTFTFLKIHKQCFFTSMLDTMQSLQAPILDQTGKGRFRLPT